MAKMQNTTTTTNAVKEVEHQDFSFIAHGHAKW